jgi:alanine racemase
VIPRPAWAEIDLDAVESNATALAGLVAPARLCAVVKADGYGHGAVEVGRAALRGGASSLAVALASEGSELRDAGIAEPVLVLSQASAAEVDQMVATRVEATAYTAEGIADLVRAAKAGGRSAADPVAVHLKVDTGMHRVGAAPDEAVALARAIETEPELRLTSVFTHCAVADEPGNEFTALQLERFEEVLASLAIAGVEVPCRHAANTAAAIDHPTARLDMVRCGIGLYGLAPSPALEGRVDLRPVMSLKAQVSFVKRVAAGEGISYGLRYRPERETTIATVPLGYADGVPRRLGATGGRVLIGGRAHPIAGTVTMDQITVDCGDHPVVAGDEVVLLGSQGGVRIEAQEWATLVDTITYEIVCGISPRVPRRYEESPR